MEWFILLLIVAAIAIFLVIQRSSLVPERSAQAMLRNGAKIIDVRSDAEFRQRSLPGAINVPLDQFSKKIGQTVPDKDQILLMHCVAGGRSALARRAARKLGYSKIYNLGSYARAQRIVAAASENPEAKTPDENPTPPPPAA